MSKYYRRTELTTSHSPSRALLLARVPWRAILIAAIIAMSLVYLWLVNGSAASGFEVSRLETQQKSMNLAYDKAQQELASAQSLDRLTQSAQELGLVPVTNVVYVDSAASTALR